MTANMSETVLYRALTFSLLLASHGGINLRLQLIAGTNFSIFALRVFGIY